MVKKRKQNERKINENGLGGGELGGRSKREKKCGEECGVTRGTEKLLVMCWTIMGNCCGMLRTWGMSMLGGGIRLWNSLVI